MDPHRPPLSLALPRTFTLWTLAALAAGFALGALAHALEWASLIGLAAGLEPLGTLWVNALRMIVIPLVVASLLCGLADHDGARMLGKLGAWSFGLFVAFLLAGTALTLLLAPLLFGAFGLAAGAFGAAASAGAGGVAPAEPFHLLDWLAGMVPANPFRAAADGAILPLLVFTTLVALALQHASDGAREALLPLARGVREVMFVLMGWILRPAPVAVFILALGIGAREGGGIAGAVGIFIAVVCVLLAVFTLLLYPLTSVAAGVGPVGFARAAAPAQTVALSTRSSLASLPALLAGAERGLGLPRTVSAFVLPLAVATFKPNSSVSSLTKMMFLAIAYGIDLDPARIATFVTASLMLSFGSPGVPNTPGSVTRLPAYLAAGIPLEGVMLMSAVDAIPDLLKTVLNVTANLSVAAIVARHAGTPEPVAEPAPARS